MAERQRRQRRQPAPVQRADARRKLHVARTMARSAGVVGLPPPLAGARRGNGPVSAPPLFSPNACALATWALDRAAVSRRLPASYASHNTPD